MVFSCIIFYLIKDDITARMLFYARNYFNLGLSTTMGILYKSIFLVLASFITIALLVLVPSKKYPVISTVGKNTMAVYLLHGFIVRIIERMEIIYPSNLLNVVISFIMSIIIVMVLSTNIVSNIVNYPLKKITGLMEK